MNDNLYITDDFQIPSLNTEMETREIKGRDGFILGEKKVKGYNFPIPFHYINHENKGYQDIINELTEFFNRDEEVRLRFENEYWYWNATFTGTIEFKQHTQGFVSFELNCIIADPYKYSNERYSTVSEEDHLTILNNGTAHTYPIFKATALEDSTMFMIAKNDDDYFMIGEPEDAFRETKDLSPSVYRDDFDNLVGWSHMPSGDNIPDTVSGGELGGLLKIDGGALVIDEEPDKAGWRGASVKRSLSRTLQDFDITVAVGIHPNKSSNGVGKAFTHLYDESGHLVATLGVLDAYNSNQNARLYVGLFDEYGDSTKIVDYPHQMFNKYDYCHIRLIRKGNEFKVTAFKVHDWETYRTTYFYSHRYISAGDLHTQPIRQVGVYLARHSQFNNNSDPKVLYMRVLEPLEATGDENALVIKQGDEIEIDTQSEIVLINEEPAMELKDFGSTYFSLDTGLTEVLIEPQHTFDVSSEWRDRFH